MKMNVQNPGGEVYAKPTMKGCELGMGRGKGSLSGPLVPKYHSQAPGMEGMAKGAHIGKTGHVHSGMTGSTVSGTSKASK